jgi:membrane protein DedA with SNARE-associated domain
VNNQMRQMVFIGVGVAAAVAMIWLEGHFALFAWMVASGLGVPPGEDLRIASTGALVAAGELARWMVIPMAIVAVVTSDTLLFTGGQVARSAISGKTTWWSERAARCLETLIGRREALAIAIGRFVPGIRTLVFVSLGAQGLSRGRFLLVDACAAAVWVPMVMTCGAAIIALVLGEGPLSLGAWR